MPYGVKKQGNKWIKYRKDTGEVVSHHDTKQKAYASIRAYYANKGKRNVNEGIDSKGSKDVILNLNGKQKTIKIKMEKYNNGATACVLLASDGQPLATLSINVAGKSEMLPKGEFFLKDYSENREIVDQFIKQGILVPTGKETDLPHTIVKSYKISNKYKTSLNEADPKVNDYKITYVDKNGKPQEMTATIQDYKEKVDDLKKAGNKNIAAAKITDVVREQKLRKLIKQNILKENDMLQKENLLRELIKKQILKELKLSPDAEKNAEEASLLHKGENVLNDIISFFEDVGLNLITTANITIKGKPINDFEKITNSHYIIAKKGAIPDDVINKLKSGALGRSNVVPSLRKFLFRPSVKYSKYPVIDIHFKTINYGSGDWLASITVYFLTNKNQSMPDVWPFDIYNWHAGFYNNYKNLLRDKYNEYVTIVNNSIQHRKDKFAKSYHKF